MRLRRFLFGVVPVLALVAGCGEAGGPFGGAGQAAPVQPRLATESTLRLTDVHRVAAYKVAKSKPVNLWAKAWIGPAGGTLSYYGFRMVVPAGAVDKVTMFTLTLPKEGTERAVAEFGPHNVKFAQPITVELPYVGTTSEGFAPGVLWFDESIDQWVREGGVLTADGQRVQLQVWHFSMRGTEDTSAFGGSTSSSGG
jgi:hypothetical protein